MFERGERTAVGPQQPPTDVEKCQDRGGSSTADPGWPTGTHSIRRNNKTGLQAAAHWHGRQKHPVLREVPCGLGVHRPVVTRQTGKHQDGNELRRRLRRKHAPPLNAPPHSPMVSLGAVTWPAWDRLLIGWGLPFQRDAARAVQRVVEQLALILYSKRHTMPQAHHVGHRPPSPKDCGIDGVWGWRVMKGHHGS
ncbi:hypothetical protein AALO_G00163700 [Alosa alosa]|uniref:Uncharacterized protein n=1 Tax=Alosa alosa TaxID=278164 RepID=A0AAV6GAW8_9TELE|nr:hypothetical protein AALO_G00163700 [Alosa alosa]